MQKRGLKLAVNASGNGDSNNGHELGYVWGSKVLIGPDKEEIREIIRMGIEIWKSEIIVLKNLMSNIQE